MTTDALQPSFERCGGCAHYATRTGPMAKHGFERCALQAVWASMSRHAECFFRPTLFRSAP